MSEPATILMAASSGFEARLLLRSGIFKAFEDSGARLVVLVPNADESYIQEEFARPNVYLEQLKLKEYQEYADKSRLEGLLKLVRAYSPNWRGVSAEWRQNRRDRFRLFGGKMSPNQRRSPKFLLVKCLVWAARRFGALRRGLFHLENRLFRPDFHKNIFRKYRPDLLVVGSPGYWDWDTYLMREAADNGVPTASVVLSYDNPNTKGYPGASPDHVVACTAIMRRELIAMADIPSSVIHVGGVTQFDIYQHPELIPSREQLCARYGLDPQRKILLLGSRTPSVYPNHHLVRFLAEAIEQGRLSQDCQLLVRLHPIYYRKKYSNDQNLDQDRRALLSLGQSHRHLHFAEPDVQSEVLQFDLALSDAGWLGSCLNHSDVVVCAFSTLILEAALVDTPLVNVIFDVSPESRPSTYIPLGMAGSWSHNARIIRTGGFRLAYNQEELIDFINLYLQQPNLDADGRARLRENECGPQPWDGNSGYRIGEHLLTLIPTKVPATFQESMVPSGRASKEGD